MSSATGDIQSRPNVRFRQVGRPLTRTDAPGKVAGRTPYAGDYVMPGMLHVRVVRADIASARLVRLDVSRARALEGVACVLVADDLPDRTASTDIPGQVGRKRLDTGQQILVGSESGISASRWPSSPRRPATSRTTPWSWWRSSSSRSPASTTLWRR